MKKPSKFEDITVSPDFISELFRIEHSVEYDSIGNASVYIQIMCEFCSEIFTKFQSGFPRTEDYVNIGAKHYFKHHWLKLKPFVIEPEPEPLLPSLARGGYYPPFTTTKGGMIYTVTTGSTSVPPVTHHGSY